MIRHMIPMAVNHRTGPMDAAIEKAPVALTLLCTYSSRHTIAWHTVAGTSATTAL